jgi:hypothetical protein
MALTSVLTAAFVFAEDDTVLINEACPIPPQSYLDVLNDPFRPLRSLPHAPRSPCRLGACSTPLGVVVALMVNTESSSSVLIRSRKWALACSVTRRREHRAAAVRRTADRVARLVFYELTWSATYYGITRHGRLVATKGRQRVVQAANHL